MDPRVPFLAVALAAVSPAAEPFRLQGEEARISLLITQGKPLEAREAAREWARTHPGSWFAHEILGYVYLNVDADLPKALHHLQRARELLEARYAGWAPGSPAGYYGATLNLITSAQRQMGRPRDALATLRKLDATFVGQHPGETAWLLMKLGRMDEARAKAREAIATGEEEAMSWGYNALAAIESESDRPEAAFEANRLGLELELRRARPDCALLRNSGLRYLELGDLEGAERHFLLATRHFSPTTQSEPWKDLALLYLEEGRTAESMDAVRRMNAWAYHLRPLQALAKWGDRQIVTAGLLERCGYPMEALELMRRAAKLPDRPSTGSARPGQLEAGQHLFHAQLMESVLERDAEAWSSAPWKRRPALLATWARHRLEAAMAAREATQLLMADRERFRQTLRYLPPQNCLQVPGGLPILARLVGPGPVEAEARRLLDRGARDRDRGFLLLALASARMERGDAQGTLEALDQAGAALPKGFSLLRLQSLGLRARARVRLGGLGAAVAELAQLMAVDGGEIRRQGLRLPCTLAGSGRAGGIAVRLLQGSPRLAPGKPGFRLTLSQDGSGGLAGVLTGPRGEVLCQVKAPRGADDDATARAFCEAFHARAFSPRIDLSQQQIHALEGSTLASQDAREELKGILALP